jgi:hypothetical protein
VQASKLGSYQSPDSAELNLTVRHRYSSCCVWLLMISQPTSAWAQEDHVVTGQTSCIIQGWFNVTRVNCECNQGEAPGLPTWECVATAICNK